jgi:hypothetical protein
MGVLNSLKIGSFERSFSFGKKEGSQTEISRVYEGCRTLVFVFHVKTGGEIALSTGSLS